MKMSVLPTLLRRPSLRPPEAHDGCVTPRAGLAAEGRARLPQRRVARRDTKVELVAAGVPVVARLGPAHATTTRPT